MTKAELENEEDNVPQGRHFKEYIKEENYRILMEYYSSF